MTTALITGASSGIGAEFATALAERGLDLVLVARSESALRQLGERLSKQYGVRITVIVQDLTMSQGPAHIYQQTQDLNLTIDLLVNNAGFGDYGLFAQSDRQRQLAMIQLNIQALVDMTHHFLPGMQARQSGSILNVASIAAFQPMPYLSVYAACKAFVLSFSEALWAENQSTGVAVLAVCPGPTESNFFAVAGFPKALAGGNSTLVPAAKVVQQALRALDDQRANVVTGGLGNQVIVNLPRLLPRQTLVKAIAKLFQPQS